LEKNIRRMAEDAGEILRNIEVEELVEATRESKSSIR